MLFGALAEGERYLYHYTDASKLGMILDSGQIWLTQYECTKDPREYGHWGWEVNWDRSEEHDQFALEKDIRRSIKLACFGQDAEVDPYSFFLYRGWARARMWSQYADDQHGACLVFDAGRLEAAMAQHAADQKLDSFVGPVIYEDRRLESKHLMFSGLRFADGMATARAEFIRDHGPALFLRKTKDWETEQEFRFLMVSDKVEKVVFGDALMGLVLGPDFPAVERSVLAKRLSARGTVDLPVVDLWWTDGVPWSGVPVGIKPIGDNAGNIVAAMQLPPALLTTR